MEDDEQTICFCHCVSRGRIKQAIREGYKTLREIQFQTSASTGCGGCEYDVIEIIETETALEARAADEAAKKKA
jgi:NAD(P)H-nitrite reductase large subunit